MKKSAELTYYTPLKFYISVLMQNFGKCTANDANTAYVNSHTIFDLDIGHDEISFGNNNRTRLILSGGIANIFNISYISSVTINATVDGYYEPAPDRSFFINVRLA